MENGEGRRESCERHQGVPRALIYQVAAKSVLNRPQIADFQQSTEGVQYRTPEELPRLLESRSVEVNRHGKLSIQRHIQAALSTLWPSPPLKLI